MYACLVLHSTAIFDSHALCQHDAHPKSQHLQAPTHCWRPIEDGSHRAAQFRHLSAGGSVVAAQWWRLSDGGSVMAAQWWRLSGGGPEVASECWRLSCCGSVVGKRGLLLKARSEKHTSEVQYQYHLVLPLAL